MQEHGTCHTNRRMAVRLGGQSRQALSMTLTSLPSTSTLVIPTTSLPLHAVESTSAQLLVRVGASCHVFLFKCVVLVPLYKFLRFHALVFPALLKDDRAPTEMYMLILGCALPL